jgi:RimJ/RimL family protein N-acetyltransferase
MSARRPDVPDALETERLRLRALRSGDGVKLHAAVVESFEALHPWMPWAQQLPTLADIEAFVERSIRGFAERTSLDYLIVDKASETIAGVSGIPRLDWTVPKFEIGYWCRTRFTGRGYITETVRAVTALAFDRLGAQRVEVRCDADNTHSRRVIARCGFHLEGALRADQRAPDGHLRTTLVFSLVPDDYRALSR